MCNEKFEVIVTLDLKNASGYYDDVQGDMESLGLYKKVKEDKTSNRINSDEIVFCDKNCNDYDYDLTDTTYAGCLAGYDEINRLYRDIKKMILEKLGKYPLELDKAFVFIFDNGYRKEFRKFYFQS